MGVGGQTFIYESIGGSQIWFPFPFLASKCSSSPPPPPRPPLLSLIFLIFHAPLFTTATEKWRHEEICIFKFFCGNAHRHLIIRKYRQMHVDIYGKYFNKLLIFCWTEWNAGMEPTFQPAYVTRDQWTYTLTRIMFAEKHHKFQCMYVWESS